MPRKFVPLKERMVSFRGVGELVKSDIYDEERMTYSPVREYRTPYPYVYFDEELIRHILRQGRVRLRSPERIREFLFGTLFVQQKPPEHTRVRLYFQDGANWHLQRRDLRLFFSVYVVPRPALDLFVEGQTPILLFRTINLTFSYRTNYITAVRQESLKFFYAIAKKYVLEYPELSASPLIPIGIHLGLVDVGHKSQQLGFTQREFKRLMSFGIFEKRQSLRVARRKLLGMI